MRSKKTINKKDLFKTFLDASPMIVKEEKKNLSDNEQYQQFVQVQTKCCVCHNQVADPTIKCGHCEQVCCKDHLRKRRKLKNRMEKICDNCEDKYLFESYMKLELKAEEAILMQQEIIFEKDQYIKKELNTRIEKQQELQAKKRQIINLNSQKRQQLLKQEAQIDAAAKDLEEKEFDLVKKSEEIKVLQEHLSKSAEQMTKSIQKMAQQLNQTQIKLKEILSEVKVQQKQNSETKQKDDSTIIVEENPSISADDTQVKEQTPQDHNNDPIQENVTDQTKIVEQSVKSDSIQEQIKKTLEQKQRLLKERKHLAELTIKQLADKLVISKKLQQKQERLRVQRLALIIMAKQRHEKQQNLIKKLQQQKLRAQAAQIELLTRMAEQQNKRQQSEKKQMKEKKENSIKQSLKKSQREAAQAKLQTLLQDTVVEVIAQPTAPEPETNQMFLDDPRLTYGFIYGKYAKQQPESYQTFIELNNKLEIATSKFQTSDEKVRQLQRRKKTLIDRFPQGTVESSPQMVKLLAQLKKWEEKMREMDAEFDKHDQELEEFQILEKTYPSSFEQDFKILSKQNEKISKNLSAMERSCQQILMGMEDIEKEAEDEFEQWKTIQRNKGSVITEQPKEESKCALF